MFQDKVNIIKGHSVASELHLTSPLVSGKKGDAGGLRGVERWEPAHRM